MFRSKILIVLLFLATVFASVEVYSQQPVQTNNPILFVTQTPVAGFTSVTQTFSNHDAWIENAPRGGDLMIRYPDGSLRNLTREAGYGDSVEFQGANSIAVRQPCIHWSGTKALFSMVIGAPLKIWDIKHQQWQMYEVTGLGKGEKAVITKIPFQPTEYNNISPIYGSDDKIIFTSDMPFNRKAYLYPQLDEYENAKVVSGLWKLDPNTGNIQLLQHSPSGSFYPSIDSYGRIIFTRWDHLQRDQQHDSDRKYGKVYGTFNWSSEAEDAIPLDTAQEIFPEPRDASDPEYDGNISLHTFNQFFPWEINQDGTGEETVNHVGRHEFGGTYTEGSFKDDPNLSYIIPKAWVKNQYLLNSDGGLFQMVEDPNNPGIYYGANAREFSRETAGQILKFSGGVNINPEDMQITEITHHVTSYSMEDGTAPDPNHSGHYRNPVPLSGGKLIVSHTTSNYANKDTGTGQSPKVRYNFRLKLMNQVLIDGKELFVAGQSLTNGIVRTTSYYNGNNYIVQRTDTLWELDPVEVRSRPVPPMITESPLPSPEKQIFTEEGVDELQFRSWMKERNIALLVSRNVTTRDRNDNSQPYNLKVVDGVQTIGGSGKVYEVKSLQLFQADLLRGQGGPGGYTTPKPGRRVLAQPMHDTSVVNPPNLGESEESVKIASDGSVAAFIPAHRAMTWQLTNPEKKAIVRERYWITFQPGEIRTCASCHGINKKDQSAAPVPQNKPEALRDILKFWKSVLTGIKSASKTLPQEFALEQNFPNPFNPTTTIKYQLPATTFVSLKIYDVLGREVATLVNEEKEAGYYSEQFNAAKLSSGIYFVRLQSGAKVFLKKMMLLK